MEEKQPTGTEADSAAGRSRFCTMLGTEAEAKKNLLDGPQIDLWLKSTDGKDALLIKVYIDEESAKEQWNTIKKLSKVIISALNAIAPLSAKPVERQG